MNDVAFVVAAYVVVVVAVGVYGLGLRARVAGAARRLGAIDRQAQVRSGGDGDRAPTGPRTGSGVGLDPDPPSR